MFKTLKSLLKPTPLTKAEVVESGKTFAYSRTWQCVQCPAQLKIRARQDRKDASSNFFAYPEWHKKAGHSQVPAAQLTWNGLAEERGWKVEPPYCPACQRGLSIPEYRQLKREGKLA